MIDAQMDDRIRQVAAKQARRGALRRILPGKRKGFVQRIQREVYGTRMPSPDDIRNTDDSVFIRHGEAILGASPGSFYDPREIEPTPAELAKMTAEEKLNDVNVRTQMLVERARREAKK
jgi:hypothetical protein